MPSTPLFSVIVPAFNAAASLGSAIKSVLAQSFADYELIVIDDGSTDDTARIALSYADRAQILRQANRGPAAARNAGARVARGEWLAFLDADDTWAPHKLAVIARELERESQAVLLFSDAFCFDPATPDRFERFMPPELKRAPSRDDMMAGRFQILTSAAVVRRAAFEAVGGFSEEFAGAAFAFEDNYLWVLLSERGPFAYIPQPLVNYRLTPLEERLERYRPGFAVFARLIRSRYGSQGKALIAARRKARVTRWAHLGLIAMRDGDWLKARQALGNAVREEPWRLRNLLRYVRTYLPRELARLVTNRSRLNGHGAGDNP
ncbi:MAG TPA: glycosyltransferase family A protein [Candidatus Binataceae bacterium]|nr:glycosyltransferase family A protein [Candidatus Binataceae bacterium]